ncbi:MAG: sugar ABC transporter permease [Nitrososphaerales archaeon]|jgi:arabinogalactan oligomer/maltooligosaccharide transport system permease protein
MTGKGSLRKVPSRIRGSAYLFILPALVGLIFIVLYPFAFNIFISFTNMNVYHIRPCSNLFDRTANINCYTLNPNLGKNYAFVFSDPVFLQIVENTLIWTFANVIPHVSIGLVLAFVLNSKVRGKTIYRLFMIVPWAMPSFITLLIWRGMFNYQYGVINALLANIGISSINWLNGNCTSAFLAMVIANIWLGYPFMMIIFSGALQSIPNELYEAASIDGAVGFRQMRHVTIPLIQPTIVIALLLGCIWTFNNFNAAYLITGGGPGTCTTIFITQAYSQAFSYFNFALAATYAFIAFAMLFVPGIFWTRYTGLTRRAA